MLYLFYIFLIPFLYININIILSDFKEKKIPNKFLLGLIILLPFYYVLVFVFDLKVSDVLEETNIIIFSSQVFSIFLVAFFLYYNWIWSAGDAKYLLVLSLFITNIWVIPFVWNIAIVTIVYLIIYFLYFYLVKNIFNPKYRKSLLWDIYKDLKEKLEVFLQEPDGKIYKNKAIKKLIMRWIAFLIAFVSFRLFRLYLYSAILSDSEGKTTWRVWIVLKYLHDYNVYIILIWIIVFWIFRRNMRKIMRFIRKYFINKFKLFLETKYKLSSDLIDFIFLLLLLVCLIAFIIYEYLVNPYEISKHLKRIFSYYVGIMILWRILFYAYKVTFQIWEQDFIKIEELKAWTIVEKKYLIKLFWTQKVLWNEYNKEGILYPSPTEYFTDIDNPIDEEISDKLKEVYKTVNDYHTKNKTPNFSKSEYIKILKTFAFWIYIFLWFIITFFMWDYLFRSFVDLLEKLIIKK